MDRQTEKRNHDESDRREALVEGGDQRTAGIWALESGGRNRPLPAAAPARRALTRRTTPAADYTVATGAWARHPVEYVVLNAVTIPLVLLLAVLVRDVRALGVNA